MCNVRNRYLTVLEVSQHKMELITDFGTDVILCDKKEMPKHEHFIIYHETKALLVRIVDFFELKNTQNRCAVRFCIVEVLEDK